MDRRPPQRPQQAAQTKTSMPEPDQLELAEDLEAINASFLRQLGTNPNDKDVETALKEIESDNRAWLKELYTKFNTHHEPAHIIGDAFFAGDLEPELASLLIANESRLRELDAFLQIGDHTGELPEDSYRKSKMDFLLGLTADTVTHFEGPRHTAPAKKAIVKGIANRIKARTQQPERLEWGPVRIAVNAVLDRNEWNWDKYRDHVEQNNARRPKRSDAQATRPSDDTQAVRPSEKGKAAAKAAERPSRKERATEPVTRPSAKATKTTRPSARKTSSAKPKLSSEEQALVATLRRTSNGNGVIAESIACALEQGDYTLDEAKAKASEAGIKLAKVTSDED